MLPSQYHYIKRMWTRNYPRRRRGIISTIFWFPLKFCFFIVAAMTMTAFYIIGIVAWIVLVCIRELLKGFFILIKNLFVNLIKIFKRKKENKVEIINKIETHLNCCQELERVKELADIINSTCDFNEFVYSFEEISKKLKFLSSYEQENIFSNSTPSKDLKKIIDNKSLTEKDFIDRHVKMYGIDSLYSKKHYLYYFNVDSISYFNNILEQSNSDLSQ